MSPLPVKKKCSPLQHFKCTRHKLNFDNIDDYKVHNLKKHPGQFTCKDCGKSYQSNHHLNQHVTSIHLGMTYACDVQGCTQFFTTSKGKDLHMATHRQMQVYKCNICSLSFDLSPKLRSHKSSHSKGKAWGVTGVGWAAHANLM